MEKNLRIYIYPDDRGNNKLHPSKAGKRARSISFKMSRLVSIYDLDHHIFFVPISCHKLQGECHISNGQTVVDQTSFFLPKDYGGKSFRNITHIFQNYVESLISKYPDWNRTLGADHFFVPCHDVGFWGGYRNSKIRDTLVHLWQNDTEFDIQNTIMSWSP